MASDLSFMMKFVNYHEFHTMTLQARDLVDHFLSEGRFDFTLDAASELLGADNGTTLAALSRLRRRKQVFSPAKGLYIAVPPEYRSWGVLPGEWFIDAMMRHRDRPYYVALLTAAGMHGASHQAPQVFQVMTDRPVERRDVGRVRLRFFVSENVEADPVVQMAVPTGYVVVGSKETTVVDLISRPRHSGGLSNVATIVKEIGELRGSALARIASRRGRAIARRVGWLIEEFGEVDDLEALRQAARTDLGEPALLDPSGPRRGRADRNWALRLNKEVVPDI